MLKRKSFVIVERAAITVQHHRRAGRAGVVKNVIMLRTPQLLLHFLLEELGSCRLLCDVNRDFQELRVALFFARRDIGIIALADGFC